MEMVVREPSVLGQTDTEIPIVDQPARTEIQTPMPCLLLNEIIAKGHHLQHIP